MHESRFDDFFLGLAQSVGKIENLLDVFFSFLARKTDFFHIMSTPNEAAGFPPHKAFDMLVACFHAHQSAYLKRVQPHLINREKKMKKAIKTTIGLVEVPAPTFDTDPLLTSALTDTSSTKSVTDNTTSSLNSECNESYIKPETGTQITVTSSPCPDETYKRISIWNGGQSDVYWWNQSLVEANMDIIIHTGPILKQDLKVDLDRTRLKVKHKETVILEGEFYEPIHLDGSAWMIEDERRLIITVEKSRENWWGSILKGEKEIDLTKVESIRKINEFDEGTQSAIRKVVWDRDCELRGVKTSEQEETEEILRIAWESETSPFKGHPMNISKEGLCTLPRDVINQLKEIRKDSPQE